MRGYIKDYRKELESDIWLMPPLYHRVWQWIKYSVNHKAQTVPFRDSTRVFVGPGERITSLRQIAKGVGYYERGVWREPNVKTVKQVLDWLKTEQMIAIESNNKYTHLKVLNWELYQGSEDDGSNSQPTVSQQTLDTNKNDNNDLNIDDDSVAEIGSAFAQTFGYLPNSTQVQLMLSYLQDGLTNWHVLDALRRTAEKGRTNIGYTRTILNNWVEKKAFTQEAVMELDQAHERSKANAQHGRSSQNERRRVSGVSLSMSQDRGSSEWDHLYGDEDVPT